MSNVSSKKIIDILNSLVGNIVPVGDQALDNIAYENQFAAEEIINYYIWKMLDILILSDPQYSVTKSKERTAKYLRDLASLIVDELREQEN